jgi:GntR family transcriptional regulator, transcriptional repressor for pyruvate dehydrogenase complex
MPVSQVRPLTPIARPTIAEEIVERITNYILDENLKPGVKLPSERELMTRLSVGRSSLREAIKTLGAIGIVEVRVGEGMFVGHGQTSLLTKPLAWGLLIGEHSLREVIEARRLIEVELVTLAAQRATDDDLAEIAAEVDAMADCLDDTAGFVNHDHAFHLAIARAAHNSVLFHVLDTLRHIIRALIYQIYATVSETEPGYREHRAIFAALRAHDADTARATMTTHLNKASTQLLKLLNEPRPAADTAAEIA